MRSELQSSQQSAAGQVLRKGTLAGRVEDDARVEMAKVKSANQSAEGRVGSDVGQELFENDRVGDGDLTVQRS